MPKTGSKQLARLFKTMCGSNFSPVFPTASVESLGKYLNMWATPDEEFIVAPRQISGSVLVDSRAAAVARVTMTKVIPLPPPPLLLLLPCFSAGWGFSFSHFWIALIRDFPRKGMGGEAIVTIRAITACSSHTTAWHHKQKAHPADGKHVAAKRMTKAKGNSTTKVFPVLEAKKDRPTKVSSRIPLIFPNC
jgi:hypothetical protein